MWICAVDFVKALLDMRDKYDHMIESAFEGDKMFEKALKEAFETFINGRQNRAAELVARFIDSQLRTGNKGVTEEELEEACEGGGTG